MDKDSFISDVKANDICKDIAKVIETRFYTTNSEIGRPLPPGKNKKSNWTNERWIRCIKYGIIYWIKRKNIQLFKRKKWWKKVKGTENSVLKRKLKFQNSKNCLRNRWKKSNV